MFQIFLLGSTRVDSKNLDLLDVEYFLNQDHVPLSCGRDLGSVSVRFFGFIIAWIRFAGNDYSRIEGVVGS